MGWFDFDGYRIRYERHGCDEPMVLLHRGEANRQLWDFQVEHLRLTRDVVVPDLIGFGTSDKPDVPEPAATEVRPLPRSHVGAGDARRRLTGESLS